MAKKEVEHAISNTSTKSSQLRNFKFNIRTKKASNYARKLCLQATNTNNTTTKKPKKQKKKKKKKKNRERGSKSKRFVDWRPLT